MEFEHKVGAFDDEGLVANDKEKKDWKGIVISLLVIGTIMGAIIVSIILSTPDGDVDSNKLKLEFDMLVSDQLKIQTFNGSWLSDHEIVYVDQNGSIVVFDARTNKSSSMLVKTYDKTLHTMAAFKLSADRQSILFVSDTRHEFGALVSARYAIFNISSQTVEFLDDLVRLGGGGQSQLQQPLAKSPHIQYAAWGPDSNSLVFIESNDIYLIPEFSQSAGRSAADADRLPAPASFQQQQYRQTSRAPAQLNPLRLTKTAGAVNDSSVRNGLPDNLYRNNLFSQPNEATLWWSPDGRYLAYLSFDDSQVESLPIEYYDSYLHESNSGPKIHYEKYPRAGALNPRVSVHVADLNGVNSQTNADDIEQSTISPPGELLHQQQLDARQGHYVTYLRWLGQPDAPASGSGSARNAPTSGTANQLLIMWTNRAQSSSVLTACENLNERGSLFGGRANNWKCDILTTFSQRIPPNLNAQRTILSAINSNGTRLIFFALPRPDSIIGDHYHVAMLRGDERAPKYLTHGDFDIDRLVSYDPLEDALYFEVRISNEAERHLYKISSVGQIAHRQTSCLTCQLAEPCGYNYAHIAPGCNYLVHECLGPSVPVTRLRQLKAPPAQQAENPPSTGEQSGESGESGASRQQQQQQQQQQHFQKPANGSQPATSGAPFKPLRALNVLVANTNIEQLVRAKQMPVEKFIAIKSNQLIPCDVYVKLYLPSEIEEEKDKRFPLLVESSEIDQRNVWNRFELDWGKYLASKKQIIYAKMDCIRARSRALSGGGGSLSMGGAGGGLAASSSSQLNSPTGGGVSIGGIGAGGLASDEERTLDSPLFNAKDQVDAIKFMAENLDLYIDKRRIAIWGPSSTSAYVALATTINDDSKLIQCTIAVSPITNWRYMNSFEAERHLGLPWLDANSLKYERANLLKRSYEFALRKLLIVHGTADEQVHVQHSMQFIKSLTEHHITGGALHQMQLYPDVGHSLAQVRRHLFLTLDGFVDRCFYQRPIAIKATEWKGKVRPKLYK